MIIEGLILFTAVTGLQVVLARTVADKLTQLSGTKGADASLRFAEAH